MFAFQAHSETIRSAGNGDWGNAATWVPAQIPTSSDVVIISNGHAVNVNISSANCSSLILETGNNPTLLTISGTNILNVVGNVDIYDGNPANILATNAGTLKVGGSVTIYGNGNKTGKLTVTSGTVDVLGNFGFVAIGVGNEDNKVVDVTGTGSIIIGGQFINQGSGTITPQSVDNIFLRQSYFKSAVSGDWSLPASWLISKDNISYYSSPVIPNASALGILIESSHTITLSTNSPAAELVVNGSLDCNRYIVNGPGPFTLNDNATFITSNPVGLTLSGLTGTIQVEGDRSYSTNANYTFTGPETQCTGSGFPAILNGVLTINKSSANFKVSICNPLLVTKQVNVVKGELASNGNLTLQATASSHANIGNLSGDADVTGNVNIQVYMTGGSRSARLVSSPINEQGLQEKTFKQLQKYILVTGPGGTVNGFDKGGFGQPYAVTLNLFKEATGSGQSNYIPVSNIQNSIAAGVGFHAFFRGKKGTSDEENYYKLNRPYSIPEDVTVTYTGPINKYDLAKVVLSKTGNSANYFDGYNLVGNPYPSTIDYHEIPLGSAIQDELMIVKPNGTQTTYIKGAGGNSISNNGGSRYIQPGQGFYLRATSTTDLVFKESFKSTSNNSYAFLNTPTEKLSMSNGLNSIQDEYSNIKLLQFNLQDGINSDETTIAFNEDQSGPNRESSKYHSGSTVSLFSIKDGTGLAINFMTSIRQTKQIKLFVNSTMSASLKLNFTDLSAADGYQVLLKDALMPDTLFDVKKLGVYAFDVNKTNTNTYGADRFSLLFELEPPVSFVAKAVTPNVQLTWTSHLPKEVKFFEVEVAHENGQYQTIGQVYTGGNVIKDSRYSFVDKKPAPGLNLYRLKQVALDGSISYSDPQMVNFSNKGLTIAKQIVIFPNPAVDRIKFEIDRDNIEEIEASVYDVQGKRLQRSVFPSSDDLSLSVSQLSKGIYFLEIKKNKDKELIGRSKFVVGL